MNIGTLLENAPGLMDAIKDAGVPEEKIPDFGKEVTNQLSSEDGFDLSSMLTNMDADSFMEKMNIGAIAGKLGISTSVVQTALATLAPQIAKFTGGKSAFGSIGAMAAKFFNRG